MFRAAAMNFHQHHECSSFDGLPPANEGFCPKEREELGGGFAPLLQCDFSLPQTRIKEAFAVFSPVFLVSICWDLWRKIWQEDAHMHSCPQRLHTPRGPTSLHSPPPTCLLSQLSSLASLCGFCPRQANVTSLLPLWLSSP